jgi:hypothetical protein
MIVMYPSAMVSSRLLKDWQLMPPSVQQIQQQKISKTHKEAANSGASSILTLDGRALVVKSIKRHNVLRVSTLTTESN